MIRPAAHRHARRASCVVAFLATLIISAVPAHAAAAEGPLGLTSLELAFTKALALIALACLFVPLSKRFSLGTVIGTS